MTDEPDFCSFDLDAEAGDPMNPLARPYDTVVTAALAAKARELWGDNMPAETQAFLDKLRVCYNSLSPYNDYDLDIDL